MLAYQNYLLCPKQCQHTVLVPRQGLVPIYMYTQWFILHHTAMNFHWKNFPNPHHLPLHYRNVNFCGIYFRPCSKDCHRLYIIVNTRQINCRLKFSPIRAKATKFFSRQKYPAICACIIYFHAMQTPSHSHTCIF